MTAPRVPQELLDKVVAYFHPRRVIRFGSAARGRKEDPADTIRTAWAPAG